MPIDPADSALDTVAAYFGGLTGIASGRRGWPEYHQDLDLALGPVVTLSFLDDERSHCAPHPVEEGPTVTWRVADYRIHAQLDLWAAHRSHRDAGALVVEEGLHPAIPRYAGLRLSQADYYGRPLSATATAGRSDDQPTDAQVGRWRRTWRLRIDTDLVVQTTTPPQAALVLRIIAGDVAEPDHTLS